MLIFFPCEGSFPPRFTAAARDDDTPRPVLPAPRPVLPAPRPVLLAPRPVLLAPSP